MSYCDRVVVQVPGKVNLSLDIVGTNDRGYHLMEMVMAAVDLSDVLLIGRRREEELRITCSSSEIPEDDTNIVHKAVQHFFQATGLPRQGLSVHIDKRLPVQAGLAGGSADAAGVLVGLNRLLETGLSQEQLCEIGLRCGADVPFCIVGGCCYAQGVGEVLTPLPGLPDAYITIAKPDQGMSTALAFKRYDETAARVQRPNTQALLAAVREGDLAGIGANMFNVLEQVNTVQGVEILRGVTLVADALGAAMTGSGTAVIGLFAQEKPAKRCVRKLREQVRQVFLARPVDHGAQILHFS